MPPESDREQQRNVVGGPVRTGNRNPGQGRGGVRPGAGRPPGRSSDLSPVRRAVGEVDLDSSAHTAARATFDRWFSEERLLVLLESLLEQAANGHVQAAFGLIHLKVGKPSTITGTPPGTSAAELRSSLDRIVAQARSHREITGQPEANPETLLAEGIWLNDPDDDESTGA